LVREAVQFCKNRNYKRIYLWTFEGLDVARHLYEREGFLLSLQNKVHQWGACINEQMFELKLPEKN
jgi:hypothetical protein